MTEQAGILMQGLQDEVDELQQDRELKQMQDQTMRLAQQQQPQQEKPNGKPTNGQQPKKVDPKKANA